MRDSLSGETLTGATVSVNGDGKNIAGNQFGFYSITLPRGTYLVVTTFAGYEMQPITISPDRNIEHSGHIPVK